MRFRALPLSGKSVYIVQVCRLLSLLVPTSDNISMKPNCSFAHLHPFTLWRAVSGGFGTVDRQDLQVAGNLSGVDKEQV